MSTAWDDDHDEYAYDDCEMMYRGWRLAQEAQVAALEAERDALKLEVERLRKVKKFEVQTKEFEL